MLAKNLQGAAAAASPVYVEDTFSTYLYTGTGSTQTITNGIDLSGKGGLVWIKGRSGATGHRFTDTARGATKSLASNSNVAEATESTGLTAFSSTGFTIGADADYNTSAATYVSWAFREQAKFFDVVTYTGNATAGRTVAHNLGSVPGCIIVKRTDGSGGDWAVYHRSIGATVALFLNGTDSQSTSSTYWNNTAPTSTDFTVGTNGRVNSSGGTYVAYLFAHDAGGFGASGSDNVISCGSYTTDGSGNATVNLGYEPQWLLVKSSTFATDWIVSDTMRGIDATGTINPALWANKSDAESGYGPPNLTSTGFKWFYGVANTTYIYIAIRRGPMKTPTSGTSVFTPVTRTGTGANTTTTAGFPVDMGMTGARNTTVVKFTTVDRMRGSGYLTTVGGGTETADTTFYQSNPFDNQTALKIGTSSTSTNDASTNYVDHLFRRAPGFFDVVCYTGTGANTTVSHNLRVAPELMIIKRRNANADWRVYSATTGNSQYTVLNSGNSPVTSSLVWNDTSPTSSVFTIGTANEVNASSSTYFAYLFATVSGVSKVGSYTGTGTTQQINCGFTGGARYVLIKRTDSSGAWYVWDSARGIVAGDDPYLLLNSTAAEVTNTDYVDTFAAGFEISSTAPAAINANGGTFIFLAIA
jgi:hypothetical protein